MCLALRRTSASLFTESDPVVQLTGNNLDSLVISSPTSWVVQFYADWCGQCQRFAPKYIHFAEEIESKKNSNFYCNTY